MYLLHIISNVYIPLLYSGEPKAAFLLRWTLQYQLKGTIHYLRSPGNYE